MKLLLVQHGTAKSRDEDPERSLNDQGIRGTKKIAAWLGKQPIDVAKILHSGKKRAEQTAAIFADRLAPPAGMKAVAGLAPNDDVLPLAERMSDEDAPVMIVGHLPFLARLTGLLLAGDPEHTLISFVNSGVVCLEKNDFTWSIAWIVVPEILP